jgi:electron-transferring-flavoprotein dehydrogenase
MDQGTDAKGEPEAGFMPGMDIRARLTVVGDGPVGSVGQALDRHFGLPEGHHQREWAVGMKMLVDLPEGCPLQPGTVFHTLGYPEPEIFGFLYVHPGGVASLGIFVPTWFDSPTRTAYRYMQHWMRHPYLWRYLEGGTLRSWGAKTLQESGRQGEPHLVGDGYARIGEGSGSTNVLTGSGVDEAWTTGVLLAEVVAALWREGKPMTRENLRATYVRRRRESWVEQEGRVAEHARDGFQRGFLRGLIGMAMAGWTGGQFYVPGRSRPPHARVKSLEDYYRGIIPEPRLAEIRSEAARSGSSLHDAVMKECGWPEIPYDGKLLISQQDALLVGGKVQAPAGYKDHVVFLYPQICERCENKVCIEMCSAQAITPGEDGGVPDFEREKCVHCGVCLWNCSQAGLDDPEHGAIRFESGAGGLHSAEN